MDKVKWLQQMVERSPQDAQAHYWLGKELAENGSLLEAVQSFSTGIACCQDEELRLEIIQELTAVSSRLQQQKIKETVPSSEELLEEGYSEPNMLVEQQTNLQQLKPKLKVIEGNGSNKEVKSVSNTITFEDVAGLEDLKKTITLRIISPFFNKGLFAKFKKKSGGGVLLYGPPGCGKTFIARATAGECKANFYPVHITDILDPYIGVSEQNLKDIFDKARFQKPSIMFFDEVDTIGYSRSKSSSHLRGVIDTFLSEMEGIDTSTDEVLVMAATNTPWDIDNALKRPGRFDRLIFVAPPDEKARRQIFQLKLMGRYAEEIDVAALAKKTEFYSGADIENVVEMASENVLEEILTTGNERPLNTNDLMHALSNQQASTLDWLRTAKNYVKYSNQSGLYNDIEKYLQKHSRSI
ncbi:ATP-binding protein [Psychrobacillus sp. NEAU-3TGS]|uniref:ATP-binding protein n=1 Tax=Psychrobacillus sp. NEAU-3TGS TaxID=2995412 RepID=UPI0024967D46|nr:ATP-binding protein [Psychrobacillus sp. NEAU-3TGS]MDI2588772.1 ATP-binding protein [Psychrobacillus sp. NEAU-3TGS]